MKKLLVLISSLLICLTLFVNVSANSQKIVDEIDYLSDSEEQQLNQLINNYIDKTNFDMVVYVTDQVGNYFDSYDEDEAITKIADDFYDNNGYGIGEENNGIIMCIIFGEATIGYNTYTITTCGNTCINTYTDYALDNMFSNITNSLSNYGLASGIEEFVDQAIEVYDNYDYYHRSNDSYDDSDYYQRQSHPLTDALGPAFFGAIVIALVYFFILRGQLKNTGIKRTAGNYMSNQNINIFRSGDVYLYTNVSRHKIEREEPSRSSSFSSHSSTHHSSSGVSHGGGGSHRF